MTEQDAAEMLRILRKVERVIDLALRVPLVRRALGVKDV